ncbi:hypothetical protein [Halosimplex amylolyticum]|uniref:hypothetical protein n=1 Tax=Halosimplex amylolyticum TaxID=3396616 RepID=UPI003F5749AC
MDADQISAFDNLVVALPGGILLLLLLALPEVASSIATALPAVFLESLFLAAGFSLLSYALGYVLQTIGSAFEDQRAVFQELLVDGFKQGNSNEYRFVKGAEKYFKTSYTIGTGPDESLRENRLPSLFWLVRNRLYRETNLAERWLMLEQFSRSLIVAFALGTAAYSVAFPVYLLSNYTRALFVVSAVPLLLVGTLVAYRQKEKYETAYGHALIQGFYSNVLIEADEITEADVNRNLVPVPNRVVSSDGNPIARPLVQLRRLRTAITQRVTEPLRNEDRPTQTELLFLYFSSISDLLRFTIDDIFVKILEAEPPPQSTSLRDSTNENQWRTIDVDLIRRDLVDDEQRASDDIRKRIEEMEVDRKLRVLDESGMITNSEKGQIIDAIETASSVSFDVDDGRSTSQSYYDFPPEFLTPVEYEFGSARAIESKVGNAFTAARVLVDVRAGVW